MAPPPASPFLPSSSEADNLFREEATARLRSTLRLPATNPVVARWLFSNRHSDFHPDASLLPPAIFSDALVIRIVSDVTSFGPTPANPFATPFAALPALPSTRSASLNLLLAPAAYTHGLVLGYSVALGNPFDDRFYPFSAPVPPAPRATMRGRFAFCPAQNHMICVVHGLSPHAIGIIGLEWLQNNRRNRYFFTVPNENYHFNRLPTKVLALLKNAEYKVARSDRETITPSPQWFMPGSDSPQPNAPIDGSAEDSFASFSRFLEDDDLLQATTPLPVDPLPNPTGSPPTADAAAWSDGFLAAMGGLPPARQTATPTPAPAPVLAIHTEADCPSSEGTVPPGLPGPDADSFLEQTEPPTSSGVVVSARASRAPPSTLDMTSLFHSLLDLERSLEGRFFAPRMSRDIMNPLTGEITSRTTGELRASLELAAFEDARVLREITAQAYYATALAVTTDRLLMCPSGAAPAKNRKRLDSGENEGVGSTPCSSSEPCMARKKLRLQQDESMAEREVLPLCVNCRNQAAEAAVPVPMDANTIREAKKEAKRRKNRLSAARSNQRKKERVEAQNKELVELKERMVKLKEAQSKLIKENSNLRQQCSMQE